jgi:4-hydroxybenzoate polyprenyltransferase
MSNYLRLMRPEQWVKNLVVLAGPAFGLKLLDPVVLLAFAAFCLAASACYAINDVLDREADRNHPDKSKRPVASGAVSPGAGLGFGLLLLVASVLITYLWLPDIVSVIVLAYFALILAYSVGLKNRPILDVIIIATGFVLRAVGGAEAVGVFVSPWLVVCTFTLCMFLGFGKRRCELLAFANKQEAGAHRSTLARYTPELLNHLTSVSAGIAIMTFLIYTMDRNPHIPQPGFEKEYLLYTLPLVAYALFRCAMLIGTGRFSGPTEIVLRDKALILTGILWVAAVVGIVRATQHAPPSGSLQETAAGVIAAEPLQ